MDGDERSPHTSEAPNPQGDTVWTRMAQIQASPSSGREEDGTPPSFSQNPKQVLVMPDFWYVRKRDFHHQHCLLCGRQIFAGASQLPAPCIFPVDGVSLRSGSLAA